MAKVMTTLTQNNSTIAGFIPPRARSENESPYLWHRNWAKCGRCFAAQVQGLSPRFQTPGCDRLELEPVSEVLSLPEMDRCHTPRVGVAVRRCQAMMVGNIGNRRSEKYSHLMRQ
jgi:hypothetical protein